MAFFNYRQFDDSMAEGEGPPVYVVDTRATRPPLPPRLDRKPKRTSRAQTLLFVLVSLAMVGLFSEACFIYYLHQTDVAASPVSSKQTGDAAATRPLRRVRPSKPLAHMTGGDDVVHDQFKMAWSRKPVPTLYNITYSNGSLVIHKQGYYYIYSKVFFSDSNIFYHYMKTHSKRYRTDITLLLSRKYSPPSATTQSNSFLGGVFYFEKDDTVFVSVNDTKKIRRYKSQENVFGAYMI